jgi:hypothetical protein
MTTHQQHPNLNSVGPGADADDLDSEAGAREAMVYGFYEELFLFLPPAGRIVVYVHAGCPVTAVSKPCFADDEAALIAKTTGKWRCSLCGEAGGPLEAAIGRGYTPEEGRKLVDRHGLCIFEERTP